MRRIAPALVLAVALLAAGAPPLGAVPDAARGDLDRARAALARGDGIAAEADLRRAEAAGAVRRDLAVDMGEALIQQGQRRKAREWLQGGDFAKGEEARGWRLLALLERLDGNLPAAGRALDRALATGANDPLLWVEIGRLRYQGGEHLLAVEAADRALLAGPEDPRALEFKAQLLRDSGGDTAAIALLERALAAAPDDLLLLGGYAASLGEQGRASEMLAVTRKMLALDPDNAQAFFLQAVLAARAGRIDLARAMLNRVGRKLDNVPAALLLNGVLELEAGNANVAAQYLLRLADRQGANQRAQLLLARALYQSGDYQQLFARFGGMAARGDAPPYLLSLLGRAREEQGDRAGAADLLNRAAYAPPPQVLPQFEPAPPGVLAPRFAEAPGAPGVAVPYVRSLLASGNPAGAGAAAARFLERRPGSVEALGVLGDVEVLGGQPLAALPHYEAAATIRFPDRLALRYAIALEQAGRPGQVPPLVGRYLTMVPGSRLMARVSANLALSAQDWPRARLLLESLRLRGGGRDARLLADLSLAQLRSGDTNAALASAEQAWRIAPASPFVVTARALALAHAGRDPDLARQLIEQARKTGGDNPLLAEARKKLV